MIYFLIIFFIVSLIYTLFHLSLAETKQVLGVGALVVGVCTLLLYPYAITQNNQSIENILANPNLVSAIAIFQIFEALAMIFLATLQLRGHYNQVGVRLSKLIPIWPSFLFLGGMLFLQTFFFLRIEGGDFLVMAIAFATTTSIVLFVGSWLLQKIIANWATRAELQLLVGLFQVLLAMFLPLMAKGLNVPFSQLSIDYFSLLFTWGGLTALVVMGYYLYQRKNKL